MKGNTFAIHNRNYRPLRSAIEIKNKGGILRNAFASAMVFATFLSQTVLLPQTLQK